MDDFCQKRLIYPLFAESNEESKSSASQKEENERAVDADGDEECVYQREGEEEGDLSQYDATVVAGEGM